MRKIALLIVAVTSFLFAGCALKQDCPGCTTDDKECSKNADCTSPAVCLDGQCTILKDYCASTGICGLAVAECKCEGGVTCPAIPDCNPQVVCPPAPDCTAECSAQANVWIQLIKEAAPDCSPKLTCPPAPSCNPTLSCPKCPDLISPVCRDCTCVGGVTSMTLGYNGTVGATVTVTNTSGTTLFTGHVNVGGAFSFTGLGTSQLMGTTIGIKTCKDTLSGTTSSLTTSLNGTPIVSPSCITTCTTAYVKTDCTTPVAIGTVFGDYAVLDGTSKTNGQFCQKVADGGI